MVKKYMIPFVLAPETNNHPQRWEMDSYPWYSENSTIIKKYYNDGVRELEVEWRDIYEFETEMKVVAWSRGRSSTRIIVKGNDETLYSMTFNVFMELIKDGTEIKQQKISKRKWTFTKKGPTYTVIPVKEKENDNG